MRIFEESNFGRSVCPICGKAGPGPVVLIGIIGTEDGYNIQARQYHVDCLELFEYTINGVRIISYSYIPEVEG